MIADGRPYGVFAASVGKAFGERLHGFAEVAAPQTGHGTQAIVDTGVSWLVNKDCQLERWSCMG